jgi:uncharacterized membrane protein
MNGLTTYDEWHLVSLAPWGRTATVCAVAAAVVILFFAWRALAEERFGRRWLLLALRFGAVATALVLFFQPAVRLENVTRMPNHLAVLVDASESMGLREEPRGPSRAERAAKFLERAEPELARLRERHRIDYYTFGDRLAPADGAQLAHAGAPPHEEATRLREALASLRGRYDGRDLAGVIVVSDGLDNGRIGQGLAPDGSALDNETLDFLKSMDAPVHTVWTGQPGLHDVAIARVLADDFAFVHTAVTVEAIVRVVGAQSDWNGRTLPVTLRRDGAPIRTVDVTLEEGKREYRVAFNFTPERVGKYLYEISTPLLEGEAIRENNARQFLLKVIRDKIRVLLVSGRPSWDERFLRGLIKHDPNIDLISFFILRTPTDVELVSSEELSLIPFPTEELFQEQLRSFDVVFLQNFNFGPYGIGAYLGEIKRYVEEGGGLAMIGGDLSFALGGYAHTPVADVLPVELGEEAVPERMRDLAPFRMQLTPEGRVHPVTALKVDLRDNEHRWSELPELTGTNLVARARPDTTVLGVHPLRKGTDGKPLPVLTVGDAGKGRSLAFTSDSSWHWAFHSGAGGGTDGRTYQKFWENAIRWLIRDPSLSFLRIETDQPEYGRGQKVGIDVRALGTDYRPARGVEVTISVTRIASGDTKPEPLRSQVGRTDDEGELHVELEPPPPGGYRITARATLAGRPTEEEEVFLVRGGGRELEEPEARDDLLRRVAHSTGASFRTTSESLGTPTLHAPRVVRVNRHRDLELWSRWWMLVIAAVCLSANWALRRRWGYA